MTRSGFTYTAPMDERIIYVPVEWIMQNVGTSVDLQCSDDWIVDLLSYKAPYCAAHIVNIQENGFRVPIVIQVFRNYYTGEITFGMGNGHHRLTSAILLCLDEIPVFFSTGDFMRRDVSDSEDLNRLFPDIPDVSDLLQHIDYP